MSIFRTISEEVLIKKDLELQKKARKMNELSKFIEEKIIEFNLNITKTNLKEVSKHAKLIEIKYNYLTSLIRDIEIQYHDSIDIEKQLIQKVNDKINYIDELQGKLDATIFYKNQILKKKETRLILKEKELNKREQELIDRQKLIFN
jgi:hypothetical protein